MDVVTEFSGSELQAAVEALMDGDEGKLIASDLVDWTVKLGISLAVIGHLLPRKFGANWILEELVNYSRILAERQENEVSAWIIEGVLRAASGDVVVIRSIPADLLGGGISAALTGLIDDIAPTDHDKSSIARRLTAGL